MTEQIFIQVRFKEQTAYGEFNDALYFTQAEYATTPKATIDAMKQQRVDDWIYAIENPVPYIEPTLEVLKKMRAGLEEDMDRIMLKLFDKASKKELEDIKAELQENMDELDNQIGA